MPALCSFNSPSEPPRCEYLADHPRQIGLPVWLIEQGNPRIEPAVVHDGVLRYPDVNRTGTPGRRLAISAASSCPFMPPGMITSVNRRSNCPPVIHQFYCFGPASGSHRRVAEALELSDDIVANQLVILDNQNGPAATLRISGHWRVVPCGLFAATRKVDLESRSMPLLAVDLDMPPDRLTKPYTMLKPSQVPLPIYLVVKKGSNTRPRIAAGMPVPVSLTATMI
jgi:hypothetical protein